MKITFKKHNVFEDEFYLHLGIFYSKVEIGDNKISIFGIGLIFWSIQYESNT